MVEYGDDRLPKRYWAKVYPEPNTGCWLWGASSNSEGYGNSYIDGKVRRAHSVTADIDRGRCPAGLVRDHLCSQKLCVNPDHTEDVPQRTNFLRGNHHTAMVSSGRVSPNPHCGVCGSLRRVGAHGRRWCHQCTRASYLRRRDRIQPIRSVVNV